MDAGGIPIILIFCVFSSSAPNSPDFVSVGEMEERERADVVAGGKSVVKSDQKQETVSWIPFREQYSQQGLNDSGEFLTPRKNSKKKK